MKKLIAILSLCLFGCVSAGSRAPASLGSEDSAIAAATRRSDIALCRTNVEGYSAADRQAMLDESVEILGRLLPTISDDNRPRVTRQYNELQRYRMLSTDKNFWGTQCPRNTNLTDSVIYQTESGILDAFERALTYENLALCRNGRGGYTILDRQYYLGAAFHLFKSLSKDSSNEVAKAAAARAKALTPIYEQSRENQFWNARTTCPLVNLNRANFLNP